MIQALTGGRLLNPPSEVDTTRTPWRMADFLMQRFPPESALSPQVDPEQATRQIDAFFTAHGWDWDEE